MAVSTQQDAQATRIEVKLARVGPARKGVPDDRHVELAPLEAVRRADHDSGHDAVRRDALLAKCSPNRIDLRRMSRSDCDSQGLQGLGPGAVPDLDVGIHQRQHRCRHRIGNLEVKVGCRAAGQLDQGPTAIGGDPDCLVVRIV